MYIVGYNTILPILTKLRGIRPLEDMNRTIIGDESDIIEEDGIIVEFHD